MWRQHFLFPPSLSIHRPYLLLYLPYHMPPYLLPMPRVWPVPQSINLCLWLDLSSKRLVLLSPLQSFSHPLLYCYFLSNHNNIQIVKSFFSLVYLKSLQFLFTHFALSEVYSHYVVSTVPGFYSRMVCLVRLLACHSFTSLADQIICLSLGQPSLLLNSLSPALSYP